MTAARTTQRKAEQTAKELRRVQIGLEKERKARSDELRKAKARASDLEKANKDAADTEAAASAAEAARKELEAARKESEVVHSGAPNGTGRNGDGQSAIAFDTFMKSVLPHAYLLRALPEIVPVPTSQLTPPELGLNRFSALTDAQAVCLRK